ncbi:branched-chain amino acid ABC transporter permease [Pseudooceanicola sp. CBS1P-1]|uniref:Branched-chain amino acid ABC transporter permease n=1 Tax=Pseudooceanicola albus TaxID=2692189 RepID=A0A6L7GBL6_9RHOB|nr:MULTISPECIES: branched-chain amino acid ABC transporter permease [Pseudooceanicola]MBT9386771.1 branched-chain amino acid ABC transporter permease [Pseudooceanicola endophyticus]MXN20967.1 branched-chain amino acid ABC transporter permease [Pseudooceanicola albus]
MILRILTLLLAALVIGCAPLLLDDGQLSLGMEMLVTFVICAMWNVLAGYGGLVSLGHQAWFGIGGYAVFIASNALNVNPLWLLPLAALVPALIALVLTPLLFRLKDAYFAIGSWVLAEVFYILVQRSDALGGITGMPLFTGGMLGASIYAQVFWVAGGLALAVLVLSYLVLRSGFGLGLMSVRDNEVAAASIGVNVRRNRRLVYAVSAAGVGLAGAVYLIPNYFIQPGIAFSADWTVIMTFVVVIGGIGTLEGPILGTLIYFAIRQGVTDGLGLSGSWYLVALGALAVATMLMAPKGLWPILRDRLHLDWLSVRRPWPGRPDRAPHHQAPAE